VAGKERGCRELIAHNTEYLEQRNILSVTNDPGLTMEKVTSLIGIEVCNHTHLRVIHLAEEVSHDNIKSFGFGNTHIQDAETGRAGALI
jgi:hypothetical protein